LSLVPPLESSLMPFVAIGFELSFAPKNVGSGANVMVLISLPKILWLCDFD
jgi:hypothetical protein